MSHEIMVKLTITIVKMTNKNIIVIRGYLSMINIGVYLSNIHKNWYLTDSTRIQSATIMVTAHST